MTPLAHFLANQLVAPKKRRLPFWEKNSKVLAEKLLGAHFFEVTDAHPLIGEILALEKKDSGRLEDQFTTFGFLPAPKTWLEWICPISRERIAFLLEEDGDSAQVTMFHKANAQPLGRISFKDNTVSTPGGGFAFPELLHNHVLKTGFDAGEVAMAFIAECHTFLVLINSPKIIGRVQHMPHAGLEKKLARGFGVGKFPLNAWTEIRLTVAKPTEIDDGMPHEAHITGRRALHFCRKHIRIRLGKLEYVSSHWRGDASIGIKRSRYKIEA